MSVTVLLAQLSRSREEVAMLLDRVAEEQLRVNLLPFPSVHFSDIHGRIRRHVRHDGRALDYGDPQWDARTTFPFPDATWMGSGSSDSRPGVTYRQAHSSVYQRFHPVPLEALNPPSTDVSGSVNPGNRYYVWTVQREYQAFRAARAHTPHESVTVMPGRLFDSSPTSAAYFVQRPLSDCVSTYVRDALLVVRLPLTELCRRSIPASPSNEQRPSADATLANVYASFEIPAVMVVTPMPSRVRTTSLILGQTDGVAPAALRTVPVCVQTTPATTVVPSGFADKWIYCGRCDGGVRALTLDRAMPGSATD
eukprot:4241634-Pleurochrysis_carterae.AAC.1